jgi:hypothetical protein
LSIYYTHPVGHAEKKETIVTNKLPRHSNKSVVSTDSFAFLALIFLLVWVMYPTSLAAQPNLTVTLSGIAFVIVAWWVSSLYAMPHLLFVYLSSNT